MLTKHTHTHTHSMHFLKMTKCKCFKKILSIGWPKAFFLKIRSLCSKVSLQLQLMTLLSYPNCQDYRCVPPKCILKRIDQPYPFISGLIMDCFQRKLPSLQAVTTNLGSLYPISLGHSSDSTANVQDLFKVRHLVLFSPLYAKMSSASQHVLSVFTY